MDDILKNLCKDRGIKLIYTNNKHTALSFTSNNETPVLRAHKCFKGCPEDIAHAVVSYYTSGSNRDYYYDKLFNFLRPYFASKFDIQPSPSKTKGPDSKYDSPSLPKSLSGRLVEMDITSLNQKGFLHIVSKTGLNGSISVPDNDILELEVIVADLPVK